MTTQTFPLYLKKVNPLVHATHIQFQFAEGTMWVDLVMYKTPLLSNELGTKQLFNKKKNKKNKQLGGMIWGIWEKPSFLLHKTYFGLSWSIFKPLWLNCSTHSHLCHLVTIWEVTRWHECTRSNCNKPLTSLCTQSWKVWQNGGLVWKLWRTDSFTVYKSVLSSKKKNFYLSRSLGKKKRSTQNPDIPFTI